jgi:DNA-binding CsgD family transcriptional regulator
MSILQRIKNLRMGLRQKNRKFHYVPGEPPSFKFLYTAAREKQENTPAVSSSVDIKKNELYQRWILLSPREQDVTALTCLKFTNRQIAARLDLSTETVKTYIQKVLNKLSLQSKADLRVTFANWDFSAWERRGSQR